MANKLSFDLIRAFEDFEKTKKEIAFLEFLVEEQEREKELFEELIVPSFLN